MFKPPPLHGDYNTDPNVKALKEGFYELGVYIREKASRAGLCEVLGNSNPPSKRKQGIGFSPGVGFRVQGLGFRVI